MIKKFKDYDKTQGYTGAGVEQLPPGAYVCKIIGARVEENDYGQSIVIAFDIANGDQKGYYQKRFDADTAEDKKWKGTYRLYVPTDDGTQKDEWTKRNFKTFTDALEDSNTNYHFDWDEQKFKGKLFGATFATTFFSTPDGHMGTFTRIYDIISTQRVDSGKYRSIPDIFVPKRLRDDYEQWKSGNNSDKNGSGTDSDGFMNVPEGADEEVPF
jgi:hypothetical protein